MIHLGMKCWSLEDKAVVVDGWDGQNCQHVFFSNSHSTRHCCYHVMTRVGHLVVLLLPSVYQMTSLLVTFALWVIMETWDGLDSKDRYYQRTLSWMLVLSLGILCVNKFFCKCFPNQSRTAAALETDGQGMGDNSEEEESNDDADDFQDCLNES